MEFPPERIRNWENAPDEGTKGRPPRKKRVDEREYVRTQRNGGSIDEIESGLESGEKIFVSPRYNENEIDVIEVPTEYTVSAPVPPSPPPLPQDPFQPLQKTVVVDPVKIFYCSTPRNKKLQEQFVMHLTALKRWRQITLWLNDLSNRPGEFAVESSPLQEADLILLLITPDLIASQTDYQGVLDALQRHRKEGIAVIPVLLCPTILPPEIQPFEILPKNGRSLTLQRNRDATFVEVVAGISEVVNVLFASKPQNASLLSADQEKPSVFARMRGSSCAHCGSRNPLGSIYCKKCGDILLDIEKDAQIIYSPDTYIDDVATIPSFLKTILPDLRKISTQMTEEEWIKEGSRYREHQQYLHAIAAYTCAIFLESQSIPAYLNRCLAYFQIHQMHHACADSDYVHRLICQALRRGTSVALP